MDADNFLGNMPNAQALLQRGTNGSQVGYIDPFNQNKTDISSFFDWPSAFGTEPSQTSDVGKGNSSGRKKIMTSDTSMPDYGSATCNGVQLMADFQPMTFVVSNVDDSDISGLAPKAPTNTPTALADANFVDDFGMGIDKVGTPGRKFVPLYMFNILAHRVRGLLTGVRFAGPRRILHQQQC
jgi:hypothetical protein